MARTGQILSLCAALLSSAATYAAQPKSAEEVWKALENVPAAERARSTLDVVAAADLAALRHPPAGHRRDRVGADAGWTLQRGHDERQINDLLSPESANGAMACLLR